MNESTRVFFEQVRSEDRDLQNRAFFALLDATSVPVDWAYEVWADLLADLRHRDNHRRAIAAQLLCNLARSDPEARMLDDFEALLAVTRDERFVTARHTLQAIWKVGAVGAAQRRQLLDGLERRFQECAAEKNCTLIRYDIVHGLRQLYDMVGDEAVKARTLALIETENDARYRKKYASVWRVP